MLGLFDTRFFTVMDWEGLCNKLAYNLTLVIRHSALMVLNGTLHSDNTLLALNWRYVFVFITFTNLCIISSKPSYNFDTFYVCKVHYEMIGLCRSEKYFQKYFFTYLEKNSVKRESNHRVRFKSDSIVSSCLYTSHFSHGM